MPTKKQDTETRPGTEPSALPGLGLPMTAGHAAMQIWMEMGTETVRFIWDRLQQDMATQRAMLACTSLEEMQRIQADYFRSAQEQYTAEASKLLDMMGKATAGGLAPAMKGRRYDDVPL